MNSLVKHFPKNEVGRDFVVGDLHGCFDALSKALSDVVFDKTKDRLFSVGDLVDRGTQSEESIDWVAKPWFHAVRGNHEQMAIGVFEERWPTENYISNGGEWFTKLSPSRQKLFVEIFESLPIAIEIDHQIGKIGIVHADVPCSNWNAAMERIIAQANDDSLLHVTNALETALWSRKKFTSMDTSLIEGIDRVYVGHTPIKEWIILGNVYFIDTGCVFSNKLALLEIK